MGNLSQLLTLDNKFICRCGKQSVCPV